MYSWLYSKAHAVINQAVIFNFPREFPPDAVELYVPDANCARGLVAERYPALFEVLERRRTALAPLLGNSADKALLNRHENAILLAFCRLAFRHGSWGIDFHHYHNQGHILDILDHRIERLIDTAGIEVLSLRDWLLLMLFAACHDLRQREVPQFAAGIGSNERASIEETFRILQVCGFHAEKDADVFDAIELMIAGSTFDARPPPSWQEYNTAELVHSGGALAVKLDKKLDKHATGWRNQQHLIDGLALAMIAADLDTANVAESFARFAVSAENLCYEREMRSRRSLSDPASAGPVLEFLCDGQERFFFELHRFNSALGRTTFEESKKANAIKLTALCAELRMLTSTQYPLNDGQQVLDYYLTALGKIEK